MKTLIENAVAAMQRMTIGHPGEGCPPDCDGTGLEEVEDDVGTFMATPQRE